MGFVIILGYGATAFCASIGLAILLSIFSSFRGRDIWEFFCLCIWLCVVGTIGAEFLWLCGFIKVDTPRSNIQGIQIERQIQPEEPADATEPTKPSEPSPTWKFLTTPVWEMNKKEE